MRVCVCVCGWACAHEKGGGSRSPMPDGGDAKLITDQDTFPSLAALREHLGRGSPCFLFPCPGIPKPKPIQSTCHTNRKRYRQRVALWRLASDFLHALTALDSGLAVTKTIQRRERSSHGPSLSNITAAQQRLHCLCLREAARLEKERRTDLTLGNGELTGTQYTYTLESPR